MMGQGLLRKGRYRGLSHPRSSHGRSRPPTAVNTRGKTCCDQFGPWLYLNNYKASYFSL